METLGGIGGVLLLLVCVWVIDSLHPYEIVVLGAAVAGAWYLYSLHPDWIGLPFALLWTAAPFALGALIVLWVIRVFAPAKKG